jgi:hypothetical protein
MFQGAVSGEQPGQFNRREMERAGFRRAGNATPSESGAQPRHSKACGYASQGLLTTGSGAN